MEQDLLDLRKRIVESARKIAMSGDIAAETRLNVLLELSKGEDDPAEALKQAFDAAQQVAADDDKLNAYLDILYEIDSHLTTENGVNNGQSAVVEATEAPVEVTGVDSSANENTY